ncbi:MAG: ATP synthase F1 subunit epsilon [Alphaproteobacteria bacterium]|nr:ATP synthase F1 subunit epsilon [Alphaproteobacteria bacterium]
MSDTQIKFELVSPEEKLVSDSYRMVVVPGDEGIIGVLPGHSSLVTSLKAGVVKMYKTNDDKDPARVFIAGGFADITPELCTVLAEGAVNVNKLNKADLDKTLADLNEDLNLAKEEADKKRIEQKIAIVKAKIQAVSDA